METSDRMSERTFWLLFAIMCIACLVCGQASAQSQAPGIPCLARNEAVIANSGNITANANTLVDSYQSNLGPYGDDNIGSQGNVQAAKDIVLQSGATINGSRLPRTPAGLAPVTPPSGARNLGSFLINSGQNATLTAGDYVASSFTMNGNSTFTVSGGVVRIWVTGTFAVFGGSANAGGVPSNLQFLVRSGQDVNVNGGAVINGSIYAPAAQVNLNSVVFGSVVGAQVTLNSAAQVHLDTNSSCVTLNLGMPGVSETTPATLLAALTLANLGTETASDVIIQSLTLDSGTTFTPALPADAGTVPPGGNAVIQTGFSSVDGFIPGSNLIVALSGTYTAGGNTLPFRLSQVLNVPAASPGSRAVLTTTTAPITVFGAPFPALPLPGPDQNEANPLGPAIPTGPFVAVIPTATQSSFQQIPNIAAPVAIPLAGLPRESLGLSPSDSPEQSVTFNLNKSLGISGGTNCSPSTGFGSCAEPTGATNGAGIVFTSANWFASYSTDGGSTFNPLDPTTIFPNDVVGFCCDQVVQYVPSIDRFIWLLQGNGYRVASASPASIVANKGTAWTYWNLTPGLFGAVSGTGFDYPDVSVGNNSLYISWNAGFPCPKGCNSGRQVARIPLAEIQAGGTITIDYTKPSDSALAWGSHVTQNTTDQIFWAGHNGNSSLRIFSWPEGSNTYSWRDVGISSWANNTLSSATPDGRDWLKFGFPGNSIIGATRSGNDLWFAWTAGTDGNFKQDHIEMVTIDESNNFSTTQQVQIWNNGFAFAYPTLATNACTGEVGLSLVTGGNGNFENHAVGFWGDFLVFLTTGSNVGANRFGDYLSIRQDPTPSLHGAFFDAMGYGLKSVTGGGVNSDIRYAVFGRGGACSVVVQ
jgi:hypothetical protein